MNQYMIVTVYPFTKDYWSCICFMKLLQFFKVAARLSLCSIDMKVNKNIIYIHIACLYIINYILLQSANFVTKGFAAIVKYFVAFLMLFAETPGY